METILVGRKHMMIYIASPFFNEEEMRTVKRAERILKDKGYEVFSPRLHEVRDESAGTPEWSKETFKLDKAEIDASIFVVALYWGSVSDSGTAWEIGYAYGTGKPVIVVHMAEDSNLMVHEGSYTNLLGLDELTAYDFRIMERNSYTGKMR